MRGVRGSGFQTSVLVSALLVLTLLAVMPSVPSSSPAMPEKYPAIPAKDQAEHGILDTFHTMGGYFVENKGQVADWIRYYSMGNPSIAFRDDGVVFIIRELGGGEKEEAYHGPIDHFAAIDEATTVRSFAYMLRFEAANAVTPAARVPMPFVSNYFIGDDPAKWRTRVNSYGEVVYENLYDGIDLLFRIADAGLKYDVVVRPGADLEAIRLSYEGVEGLRLGESGSLELSTPPGVIEESLPLSFQGDKSADCRFVALGSFDFGFNCDGYDAAQALTIDPLQYGAYIGGSMGDEATAVTVDPSGYAYVEGLTLSLDFPTTPGAYSTSKNGDFDVFVTKVDPSGSTLIFSTYIGGSNYDSSGYDAIAVDSSGMIYITGGTHSPDFPTTSGAYDTTYCGETGVPCVPGDIFLTKLDKNGGALLYSTFIGGSSNEGASSVKVDSEGNAYLIGYSYSPDFPTTPGAFDRSLDGVSDAVVVKVNPNGTALVYSTFVGGSRYEQVATMEIDSDGNAYLAGDTNSTDFPTTPGAFDRTLSGVYGSYVTKINPNGSGLVFSTYLGGQRFGPNLLGLAIDRDRNVYLTGTASGDFPTTPGAFDSVFGTGQDVFVTKLNSSGDSLIYSTAVGGDLDGENAFSIDVDELGCAYVTGFTWSSDFPTTPDAFQRVFGGSGYDSYVFRLSPGGNRLLYSSFLGGSQVEMGYSIDVGATGFAYVTGETGSPDFPVTPGSFDSSYAGGNDGFLVMVDMRGLPNAAPVLSWTGEAGYTSDGVEPGVGNSSTTFTYKVAYQDSEGDPPANMTVRLEKPLGTTWGESRIDRESWVGVPYDYRTGAVYAFSTVLPGSGRDYWYSFNASDGMDWATGEPTYRIDAPDVDNPPEAVAVASKTSALKGEAITFDGTGSNDDFNVSAYLWEFGDGATDALPVATHSFSRGGAYSVTLTVWDDINQSNSVTISILVQNRLPVAEAGPDQNAQKNTVVTLDGSLSFDPEGDTLAFSWTHVSGPAVNLKDADTATPSFTASKVGTHIFRLRVDDGDGGSSLDTVIVTVWGLPPTADLVARPPNTYADANIEFDASGSSDPDGVIVNFSFSFGDGSWVSGTGGVRNHSYSTTGTYTVTLTVTDDDGNTSTTQVMIEVTGLAPPSVEENCKPPLAAVFATVLAIIGCWSSKRRPWKGGKDGMAVVRAFAITSLPFIFAEAVTGVISLLTGELRIPPSVGIGTAVDVAILSVGLVVGISRALRTKSTRADATDEKKSR